MKTAEFVAAELERNIGMLKWHLADFSDADMLVRPVPGANHAAWQVGHLAGAEVSLGSLVGAKIEGLPAGWADRFSRNTAGSDDPKQFASKQEILDVISKVRAGTVAWVKTLSEEQWDAPVPEKFRQIAPTVGAMALMHAGHVGMHVGQIQVIRRKLGKPVLF